MNSKQEIVEKRLGIPPDYQYKAMRSRPWLQKNWHINKFVAVGEIMNFSKEDFVLDLGTGSGNFELMFANRVNKIVGVDYNDEAIGFLRRMLRRRKSTNVVLVVSDVRRLPAMVTRGRYSKVIMVDTIEHIRINEAKKLVKKIRTLLRPEGEVLLITPNYHSVWVLVERLLDKLTIVPKFDGEQHLAKFTAKNMTEILEEAGYKDISISSFNLVSFVFPPVLCGWMLKVERTLLGSFGCLLCVHARR